MSEKPLKYYSAYVYFDTSYTIEIKISDTPNGQREKLPPSNIQNDSNRIYQTGKNLVHYVEVTHKKKLGHFILCQYMQWKFSTISKTSLIWKFRSPISDLNWIKSIIRCEFEYHFQKTSKWMRDNKEYLDEYQKCRYSGFGPEYCVNKMSDSFLNKLFPSVPPENPYSQSVKKKKGL